MLCSFVECIFDNVDLATMGSHLQGALAIAIAVVQ